MVAPTQTTTTPTDGASNNSVGDEPVVAGGQAGGRGGGQDYRQPNTEGGVTTKSAVASPSNRSEKAELASAGGGEGGDDKEESSSSDGGGKGDGGSGGGGYNADCSSSDTSSLDKGQSSSSSDRGDGSLEVPEKQMIELRIDAGSPKQGHHHHHIHHHNHRGGDDASGLDPPSGAASAPPDNETRVGTTMKQQQHHLLASAEGGRITTHKSKGNKHNRMIGTGGGDVEKKNEDVTSHNYDGRSTGAASDVAIQNDTQLYDDRQHQYNDDGESTIQDPKARLPQWNGIRIQHPMDPRIDLSTVGFVPASQLCQPHPRNVNVPSTSLDEHHHTHHRPSSTLFANDKDEPSPSHQHYPFQHLFGSEGPNDLDDDNNGEPSPLPSMEQYMKLMESVRPFFYAHGLATQEQKRQQNDYEYQQAQSEDQSSVPTSSELPTGSSDSDQKLPAVDLLADLRQPPPRWEGPMDWSNAVLPAWHVPSPFAPQNSLLPLGNSARGGMSAPQGASKYDSGVAQPDHHDETAIDDGGVGSDTASMAVLARVKRKHKKSGEEDDVYHNNGSTSNSNTNSMEWNTSNSGGSASSSEKRRVRIQHPPAHNANINGDNNNNMAIDVDRDDWNENRDEQERQVVVDGQQQLEQLVRQQQLQQGYVGEAGDDPQESTTSTSSSDSRSGGRANDDENHQLPQAGPIHYGVSAVVSEYSSSRNASSGASNINAMSTSGSGSGGNTGSGTGSGTASGSNRGGSSGSGNDQGGISSNGNGSSGSGNDVKGSSEENMDNSGENNSGENSGGNSDASNRPTVKVGQKVAFEAQDPSNVNRNPLHLPDPLHPNHQYHHHHQSHFREGGMPPQQNAPTENHADDEAVREKKIQDKKRKRMNMRREYEEKVEQEMESSEASQAGEVLIRPGKPITLDKVLSFTKTPRLVVKADPPFLVVYTNAAYCRMSGIDSHKVVGKAISSLLAIPDQYDLSQLGIEKEDRPQGAIAIEKPTVPESDKISVPTLHGEQEDVAVAAEAAGRARAATSEFEDNTGVGLERLVSASGFSRLHVIKVRSQPHHMVGRNVKILKPKHPTKRSHEDGSNCSSISSMYDGPHHFAACSMSISPVVSSEAYNAAVVTDSGKADSHSHKHKRSCDQEHAEHHQHKSKRRKHHHHYHHQFGDPHSLGHYQDSTSFGPKEPPYQRKRHLVSHYVIQLEPFDGHSLKFGVESQMSASTAADAEFNGKNRSEQLQYQRTTPLAAAGGGGGENQNAMDNPHDSDDEVDSEMSEPQKHVSAIA